MKWATGILDASRSRSQILESGSKRVRVKMFVYYQLKISNVRLRMLFYSGAFNLLLLFRLKTEGLTRYVPLYFHVLTLIIASFSDHFT